MADKKISALTGATTPLAGTEVLPIVQSGATVKVAVSDLTAGRGMAALSLTTATVQATNSGGLALKNSSGTTQLSLGAGGGDNVTLSVATNITPANITGPGFYWDPDFHELSWGKVRGVGETLTYEVSGPPGTYTLSGSGTIAGSPENVYGDTVLTIPGATVPSPDILSLTPVAATNAFALAFISVANQTYMIRTNATVNATNLWADSFSVTGEAGTTVRPVPMSGQRLFYRVRAVQ